MVFISIQIFCVCLFDEISVEKHIRTVTMHLLKSFIIFKCIPKIVVMVQSAGLPQTQTRRAADSIILRSSTINKFEIKLFNPTKISMINE